MVNAAMVMADAKKRPELRQRPCLGTILSLSLWDSAIIELHSKTWLSKLKLSPSSRDDCGSGETGMSIREPSQHAATQCNCAAG